MKNVHPELREDGSELAGFITHIQAYSLHDGPGIRTVVFFKGCPLRCAWCCNPECQAVDPEVEFFPSKCAHCGACRQACRRGAINVVSEIDSGFKINKALCNTCGDCIRACPGNALKWVGKRITLEALLAEVKRDKSFYRVSHGGLTVSGGEALGQFPFARELLRRSHNANIDTAIETCGDIQWGHFAEILPDLDLILYDLKHMDPDLHKQWTGVPNQRILDNLRHLSKTGVPIIIRLPLIPEFNLDEDAMGEMAGFISGLENIREVNLLPFHQLGKDKYQRLSRDYSLKNEKDLCSFADGLDKVKRLGRILESYSLHVSMG
jgi:pyruvate formate lyase activating enzyme